MKKQISKISLSLMMALSLNATEIYTVDELIIQAMQNSPDLQISSGRFEASKSRTDIASSSYLPTLDLHLGAGENGMSDIPSNPNDMVTDTLILGSLSLKQIIYDFGKTGDNVDSFKYNSESFSMSNEQEIANKKRDVKLAYYEVLQALALIEVQKENVKLNEIQLYRSQKYFDAGIRTKIDISDAKVELIKSKLDLKNAQYDLKLSYATLDKVVGFKSFTNEYRVYSEVLDLEDLYSSLGSYDLNLNASIEFAFENRYELKKYMADLKSVEAQNSLAKSEYYPSVYIGADYTKQSVDKFKASIPEDQWQASLNLDWNLYRGGSTSAAVEEQKINVSIASSELQKIKLSIKKETTEAYINVDKTRDAIELSQSLVKVSNEKFEQAGKRYEHGLSDYIELQQSRQGYIDAKASLVVNYYAHYQAIAYLDNAIGK